MAKKQMLFKTKGMNRDLSVSAFNPEFAFENMNLRLSTNDGNTLLSWVNEKGTALLSVQTLDTPEYWSKEGEENVYVNPEDDSWTYHDAVYTSLTIQGTPIGTAIINHQIVLFTTQYKGEATNTDANYSNDCIYVLKYSDTSKTSILGRLLYKGNMNFSTQNPLETLVSYEAEDIQKVYWVDGRNQPRLVNIESNHIIANLDTQFDFVRELQLKEEVKVLKIFGGNGTFAPGVIQYAFTYYMSHGQESNIFYTTPLYYISHKDRGASPEEKVDNCFQITITGIEQNFDYIRIYSIQRTSINGTPICKRIQDIEISGLDPDAQGSIYKKASYTDTGTSGDSVDPYELLYKGGESLTVGTLEQKDSTLFMGDITTEEASIGRDIMDSIKTTTDGYSLTLNSKRRLRIPDVTGSIYKYGSQLNAINMPELSTVGDKNVPCGGFKRGDYYRFGVQFQYKTGKWSAPLFLRDDKIAIDNSRLGDDETGNQPRVYTQNNIYTLYIPNVIGSIKGSILGQLYALGYRKIRPLVVFPEVKDRVTCCQGVVCPTMFPYIDTKYQPSYFFRTTYSGRQYKFVGDGETQADDNTNYGVIPGPEKFSDSSSPSIPYTSREVTENPAGWNPVGKVKGVEIEGDYSELNKFSISGRILTFHSPDIEFGSDLVNSQYINTQIRQVGSAPIYKTLGDISIQTETAVAGTNAAGFVHNTCIGDGMHGIVAGGYYDDYGISEPTTKNIFESWTFNGRWLVYPWQSDGSLNNDIKRDEGTGTPTSILKKKVISNLRYSNKTTWTWNSSTDSAKDFNFYPQLFAGEEPSILKIGDAIYQGNIDTVLIPTNTDGDYLFYNNDPDTEVSFNNETVYRTKSRYLTKWEVTGWQNTSISISTFRDTLGVKKNPVRMKYKSSPHFVFQTYAGAKYPFNWADQEIPVAEIVRKVTQDTIFFGGESDDALKENNWVPCGEPVTLKASYGSNECVSLSYDYGDTYYQRYDCLKTYAYTPEDINQVVEIGSFMLETHVNIDGRYDRNRGQQNNMNMSPRNFNLINPVYSQKDNFFTYKILDDEDYKRKEYINQIAYSKTKESGADIDLWTNVSLASILELDGDKGKINKIIRFNDQLLAFQDSGISQILYNERAQLSTTQGVPVELGNSGKVDGKRYLSDTIGCSNKWSIVQTPSGIYFMDSNDKSIYLFNGQLNNISQAGGFNSWCKQNIPSSDIAWTPDLYQPNQQGVNTGGFNNFVGYYDKLNQDVLYIDHNIALAWNEKVQAFTSFYSYGNTPYFCNLDDAGIWLKPSSDSKTELWGHQTGNYGEFFTEKKPYWMTLVGNPEPQMDKIFTNLEFRACVEGEGGTSLVPTFDDTFDSSFQLQAGAVDVNNFTPYLPFTHLETWNEYQHGYTKLSNKNGHSAFTHHTADMDSSLKRKFRIWRCDIPRNNCNIGEPETGVVWPYSTDETLGISRYSKKPQDRMRNPWVYLKLKQNANDILGKTEIHDVVITYFG